MDFQIKVLVTPTRQNPEGYQLDTVEADSFEVVDGCHVFYLGAYDSDDRVPVAVYPVRNTIIHIPDAYRLMEEKERENRERLDRNRRAMEDMRDMYRNGNEDIY
jgi:hypothetical protein